ncbi:hypothetical protein MML48_1g17594 [Holotrichia oblita]|uniref:Uncharacterized protein n=1 Tax=Holotrichia oblita TaxID=644536 RepID=A0ACB9TYL7_HOLOL|nr:hypothetical protein MML48_1g17594 [Holotrichia oblita]
MQAIQDRIEHRYGFPGVVGLIDGCHITIKQPTHNAIDFYNRKDYHSVILQGVCDDKGLFRDIFVGMPGRMHDARVFRISPLYRQLIEDPRLLTPQQHILGDAAYPLLTNLLKPYRDNGHLTEQQTRFNQTLAAQRSAIERAFGLLKGRWRKLKYLDMSLPDKIPEVITCACMLHNFIIINHEDGFNNLEEYDVNEVIEGIYEDNEPENNNNGVLKRNYISTLL